MVLINPVPIDLNIDSIDLILNSKDENEFLVKLFDSKNPENQNLVIPANKSNLNIEMNFTMKKLGNFQIIGMLQINFKLFEIILLKDLYCIYLVFIFEHTVVVFQALLLKFTWFLFMFSV